MIQSKASSSLVRQKHGRDLCPDQRTNAAEDRPVNGPLVRLELGLGVEGDTDRGVAGCRGRWDVNLWALAVLLTGACHLSNTQSDQKRRFSPLLLLSLYALASLLRMLGCNRA